MTEEREWDEHDDEKEIPDIDASIEALREAWKCAPDASLYELLDIVTSMPFMELTNRELIQELNDYILQNTAK